MEVNLQTQQPIPFRAYKSESPTDTCPLCGYLLVDSTFDSAVVECVNKDCPYATEYETRDVVNALAESGFSLWSAAELAMKYTASTDGGGIEAYLTNGDEPLTADRFRIHDETSANWVLKKMADIEARASRIRAMINAEVGSIEMRGNKLLQPLDSQIEFFRCAFGPQLEDWTREQIKGQKSKSIKLLHGQTGFKKSPNKMIVDDEDAAIRMLEAHYPDAVRVKKEVAKTELRKWLESECETALVRICGDPLSGPIEQTVAHIEPGEDSFYIKTEVI